MAQYPNSAVDFDGDGVTKLFDFNYPYQQADEVFVSVDGVNVPYVWAAGSTSTVEVTPAPALGTKVRVYRSTEAFAPRHLFAAGTPFLPRYVDENATQMLFALQEGMGDFARVAEVAEDALEGVTEAQAAAEAAQAAAQAAAANANRAVRVPATDAAIDPLPTAALRANKVLGFDSTGRPTVLAPASGSAEELALTLAGPGGAAFVGAVMPNGTEGRLQDALSYLALGADRVVNTVADLAGVPTDGTIRSVQTLGYYTAGDRGAALYRLSAGDTSTADSVFTFAGIGANRWKLVHNGTLTVNQGGVRTSGVAQGANLQRLITAAHYEGGVILTGSGEILIDQPILLYPRVRLRLSGRDSMRLTVRVAVGATGFATYRPMGYTPPLVLDAELSGAVLNGTGTFAGQFAVDLTGCKDCTLTELLIANVTVGVGFNIAAAAAGANFGGEAYSNSVRHLSVMACDRGFEFHGAANENHFSHINLGDCYAAFDFSRPNTAETNSFTTIRAEGCHSLWEWQSSPTQIYRNSWKDITVENPTNNPYVCVIKDPGRQNIDGLTRIPDDNTQVVYYELFPGTTSISKLESGGSGPQDYALGYRMAEELWLYQGVRHLGRYRTVAYTGQNLIVDGYSLTNITVTGAAVGDPVDVYLDRDPKGCTVRGWVSAANTVTVRVHNVTNAVVAFDNYSMTAVVAKLGSAAPKLPI